MEHLINKIYLGNCLDIMKDIPSEFIDLIVTDPPFGINFMNRNWDKAVPSVNIWKECLRILKPGAFAFIMSSPRLDVLSQMSIRLQDAGFRTDFTPIYWTYSSGFPKSLNVGKYINKKLVLDKSKEFDGSYAGFQPKPSVEVVIISMKPLSEKTYVEQALKNGKGITWLDDCRIPIAENDRHEYGIDGDEGNPTVNCYSENNRVKYEQDIRGRFPANLLVSDDILNNGQETKSSIRTVSTTEMTNKGDKNTNVYGKYKEYPIERGHADMGSFSRYFDLDNWFNRTTKNLPQEVQKVFPFLIVPKPSKSERNKGCEDLESDIGHNRFDKCKTCGGYIFQNPDRPSACKCEVPIREDNKIKGNFHPTVKPIKLMSYLITLGSRPNDLILDPFSGSGSTLIAAKLLSRNYIGIENKKEYIDICNKRLNVTQTVKQEKSNSLFNF